jgi:hypothetical protein
MVHMYVQSDDDLLKVKLCSECKIFYAIYRMFYASTSYITLCYLLITQCTQFHKNLNPMHTHTAKLVSAFL